MRTCRHRVQRMVIRRSLSRGIPARTRRVTPMAPRKARSRRPVLGSPLRPGCLCIRSPQRTTQPFSPMASNRPASMVNPALRTPCCRPLPTLIEPLAGAASATHDMGTKRRRFRWSAPTRKPAGCQLRGAPCSSTRSIPFESTLQRWMCRRPADFGSCTCHLPHVAGVTSVASPRDGKCRPVRPWQ